VYINITKSHKSAKKAVVTFCDTRSEILSRLEQVLLLDLPLSHQKAVEQIMWKSVFYFVIEVFRQELAEFDDEHIRRQLLAVIDNVGANVLHCVSKNDTDVVQYNFNTTSTDFGNFFRRCCRKSMLSNGDL